mmetsp:Transcript_24765/g.62266  ORF Transcript_24765/g.62266 Transcript_24765/m.62266 type:complete len:373 (-) Transcript_24765:775-1893(-)
MRWLVLLEVARAVHHILRLVVVLPVALQIFVRLFRPPRRIRRADFRVHFDQLHEPVSLLRRHGNQVCPHARHARIALLVRISRFQWSAPIFHAARQLVGEQVLEDVPAGFLEAVTDPLQRGRFFPVPRVGPQVARDDVACIRENVLVVVGRRRIRRSCRFGRGRTVFRRRFVRVVVGRVSLRGDAQLLLIAGQVVPADVRGPPWGTRVRLRVVVHDLVPTVDRLRVPLPVALVALLPLLGRGAVEGNVALLLFLLGMIATASVLQPRDILALLHEIGSHAPRRERPLVFVPLGRLVLPPRRLRRQFVYERIQDLPVIPAPRVGVVRRSVIVPIVLVLLLLARLLARRQPSAECTFTLHPVRRAGRVRVDFRR